MIREFHPLARITLLSQKLEISEARSALPLCLQRNRCERGKRRSLLTTIIKITLFCLTAMAVTNCQLRFDVVS